MFSGRRIAQKVRKEYPNSYKWVQQHGLGGFSPESASQERRSGGSEVELGGSSTLARGCVNYESAEVSVNFGYLGTQMPATGFSKSAPDG